MNQERMDIYKTLQRALSGEKLSTQEGVALLTADPHDWGIICETANLLNLKLNGTTVTYVVNRNVNFTNVCYVNCNFCGYYRHLGEVGTYTKTIGSVLEKIAETPFITEVCIQGGINPKLRDSYYFELISSVKSAHPHIHIHAYSPEEVKYLARLRRIPYKDILLQLKGAGLDSMPGTAAEIFSERARSLIAPLKIRTDDWIEIIKTAHSVGIPTSATIMFGHVETPTEVVEHLRTLRDIQDETAGFTEFIPLLFMPYQTKLGREFGVREMMPLDCVKLHYAVFRLFLGQAFRNLQTSWVKLGRLPSAEILEMGANDYGGTLFEESITRLAGGTHGEVMTPQEIEEVIRTRGRIPVQRDTIYNLIGVPVA